MYRVVIDPDFDGTDYVDSVTVTTEFLLPDYYRFSIRVRSFANAVSQPPVVSGVIQSFRGNTSGNMGTNDLIRFSPGTQATDGYPVYDSTNTSVAAWKANFDNQPTHFFRIFVDGNQWGSDRYNGDFALSVAGGNNYFNVATSGNNAWTDDLNGDAPLPARQNMTLRFDLHKE